MTLRSVTTSSRPDLEAEADAAFRERWPEFIFHDPVPPQYMPRVHEYFPEYDVLLLDDGKVVAGGWGVPLALTERARAAGVDRIFAPIRPTWKSKYPTTPMSRYAAWTRADGLSIDPWIRTHQRMGARIVRPAPNSMVIPGTVAEWESWADMPFPESGDYIVPDALNVVHVDCEQDSAVYREENLWVEHRPAQ